MPQMSKLPFLVMSSVLLIFFILWILNVWFNSDKFNNKNKSLNLKNNGKNWPLN